MKLRPFELALVIGFGVAGVLGLLLLSTYSGGSKDVAPPNAIQGAVTVWGTLPVAGMNQLIAEIRKTNETFSNVRYVQVSANQFSNALTNALADGNQPDLVLIPHELLVTLRPRLSVFSYQQFPLREFRDRYVAGAEQFALPEGIYGIPVLVDPLMMYWNRNLLATNGFLTPPETWESLLGDYFPALIARGTDRSLTRSVVAMGSMRTVTNGHPIIASLFIQGGSQGVVLQNNQYQILLDRRTTGTGRPFLTAVDFYTRFSSFNNVNYSWNDAQPNDRDHFTGENLVFYFGFGSEARELERRNPNLSFDIAEFPQGAAATLRRTYGRLYSLVPVQRSRNPQAASVVLSVLTSDQVVQQLATLYDVAPVKKSLLQSGSSDLYGRAIYRSAPIAYGWLSPAPTALNTALTTMIEDIATERKSVGNAVADGLERIQLAY